MKRIFYFLFSFGFVFSGIAVSAQQNQTWPKIVTLKDNSQLKIYEPQPESLTGKMLKIKSAISFQDKAKTDPVFGVLWADVTVNSDGDKILWQDFSITNLKLPAENTGAAMDELETQIEDQAGNWNVAMSKSDLDQKLKLAVTESSEAGKLSTAPPSILYSSKPAILVFVDGEAQIQQNEEWGVEQVVNTPFTILRTKDQNYYLYGSKHWYRSSALKGPWNQVSSIPSSLSKAANAIREADTSKAVSSDQTIADVIVSQTPAELVQSDGEANFAPLQGTNLLYMTNSSNDVFLDVNSQQYYVLLSGRWYTSKNLSSSWTYTASDRLPADFAEIPESSVKANVLASVAGTDAAGESVAEAQVPQTAKVDRKTATANVTYDGDPQFEDIEGTDLRYGVNSSGDVLQSGRTYYYVENGVWFRSNNATGPWAVATQRPAGVEYIPARYPVYNLKYVNIYDVYDDYVYMGYTPGYLGNYVFGPTIVYGTGYHYRPWRGRYYYPRPVTWGFNMRYNPWVGWGFGFNTWHGWFFDLNIGYRYRNAPVCWGGWWGPSVYRPPYYRNYPSYYGRSISYNTYRYNSYRSNNVYRNRRDVVTTDRLYRPSPVNGRNSYSYNYRSSNNGIGRPDRNVGGNTPNGRPSGGNNGNYNNTNGREARPGNGNSNRPSGSINNGNWNNGSRPSGNIGSRPSGDNGNRPSRANGNDGSNRPSGSINNGNWNNGNRPSAEGGNRPARIYEPGNNRPQNSGGERPQPGGNRPVGADNPTQADRPRGNYRLTPSESPAQTERPQGNYRVTPSESPQRAPERNNQMPAERPQRNYTPSQAPQRAPERNFPAQQERPQQRIERQAPQQSRPVERSPQVGNSRPERSSSPAASPGQGGGRESRRRG